VSDPTVAALIHKEALLQEHASELADMIAVETAIKKLDQKSNIYYRVLEMVYFKDHQEPLQWGEITRRIHYAEIHIPASDRQIKRWLKEARNTFADARGLRK
jgi:chaperonin cofactor prefoldin